MENHTSGSNCSPSKRQANNAISGTVENDSESNHLVRNSDVEESVCSHRQDHGNCFSCSLPSVVTNGSQQAINGQSAELNGNCSDHHSLETNNDSLPQDYNASDNIREALLVNVNVNTNGEMTASIDSNNTVSMASSPSDASNPTVAPESPLFFVMGGNRASDADIVLADNSFEYSPSNSERNGDNTSADYYEEATNMLLNRTNFSESASQNADSIPSTSSNNDNQHETVESPGGSHVITVDVLRNALELVETEQRVNAETVENLERDEEAAQDVLPTESSSANDTDADEGIICDKGGPQQSRGDDPATSSDSDDGIDMSETPQRVMDFYVSDELNPAENVASRTEDNLNHLSRDGIPADRQSESDQCEGAVGGVDFPQAPFNIDAMAAAIAGVTSEPCGGTHNNLNRAASTSDYEETEDELFNVSRQTSTSNFEMDENSFQDAKSGLCPFCSGDNEAKEKKESANERCEWCASHRDPGRSDSSSSESSSESVFPPHYRRRSHGRRRRGSWDAARQSGGGRLSEHWRAHWPMTASRSAESVLRPNNLTLNEDCIHRTRPTLTGAQQRAQTLPNLRCQRSLWQQQSHRQQLTPETNPGAVSMELCHEDAILLRHSRPRESRVPFEHGYEASDDVSCDDLVLCNLAGCERRSVAESEETVEKTMIWNEYEAYMYQVKQVGASACGATAVINILKAFSMYIDKDVVLREIQTNLRDESVAAPEYLLSRSVAGTTAAQLIAGVENLTDGCIRGRFFPCFPHRDIRISSWLASWIRQGAVPMVTLNLQRAVPVGWAVPDAWHHQMVYGVGPKGAYLTNPLEVVPERILAQQLCSPSVLKVRRQDVTSRWHECCDLRCLVLQEDPRWRTMNVIGQVVNVVRESRTIGAPVLRPSLTSHIEIPAWYEAGVSIFASVDSSVHEVLVNCPDLPMS